MTVQEARRVLEENGYSLIKSRKRTPTYSDEGGYMIVNARINGCVAGNRFQLTFEDVTDWIAENL